MIVLDSQPFSLVEDIGFKAFVSKLNPTYTIPTRKALKLMVEKRYDEAKEKAMAEVQDAEYVSLTADMWTSINIDSYLEVTCHYITKERKLATVLLGVTRFPQSHTAVNIKEAQRVCHIRCFAHTLNLVVKKALDQTPTPELQYIRLRAKSVVTLFRTSCKAKEKLCVVQEMMAAQATVSSAPTDGENLWDLLDIRVSEAQRVQSATADAAVEVK
ncbi:hypothetical protein SKAU_G00207330 [Synaphobranchus kaupii]|uniref:Uncharacterized protein n=1 Tax=Synaphobranchus kaupii TaxID=118154 RepID=A0A9Q1F8Q4_SYNKA|nr:hypothetical protein SKAU_G00207330 [Synaphobranchus kaupii]